MNSLMNEYIARKITEINSKNDDIAHYLESMPKGTRVRETHNLSMKIPRRMRWLPKRNTNATI